MSVDELPSKMSKSAFVNHFGALYEHSPWVAERAFQNGIDASQDTIEGLLIVLQKALFEASDAEKLNLINAHPDLAGKAALKKTLTADSNDEQSSAGLDQCSEEELAKFTELNNAYKTKFQFPFIMAVRGSNRHKILAAFETRLENDASLEFQTAITEINKIAELRLRALYSGQD